MLSSLFAEYPGIFPPLTPDQIAALEAHLDLLEKWNKTINLTAIRSRHEAEIRHIAESLFLAAQLPAEPVTICDLGSGGGFPGIPVAIARPDCSITLIESDIRKGVFLREASRKLPNVSVQTARFENVSGQFDWLISRAVNLAKIAAGPQCSNAAFLGAGLEDMEGKGFAARFSWKSVPLPWDSKHFVHLGVHVSRETLC